MVYRCIDCNKLTNEVGANIISRFPLTIVRCPVCQQKREGSKFDPKYDSKMYRTQH